MAKITLPTISGGYASVTQIEQGFNQIESEFQNKVLYRNNPSGEANQMENNIDMNGYMILNLANPISINGFSWEGDWVTATTYQVGDAVYVSSTGSAYICIVEHTSGTFATDLAALKWEVIVSASIPSQTGHADKFLQTNGTSASWVVPDAAEVSFTQTGTGAVANTVDNKLNDLISVKDFGATGDGTTDDSAAIQAAIDAISTAGGGTVFFPAGSYRVDTALTLKSYVTLLGTKGGVTLKQYNSELFNADENLDSAVVQGFELSYNATSDSIYDCAFKLKAHKNCVFDNLTFTGYNDQTIIERVPSASATINSTDNIYSNWYVSRCKVFDIAIGLDGYYYKHTGDGTTTIIATGIVWPETRLGSVAVLKESSSRVFTELTPTTDFTVSYGGGNELTVTLTAAATTSERIHIFTAAINTGGNRRPITNNVWENIRVDYLYSRGHQAIRWVDAETYIFERFRIASDNGKIYVTNPYTNRTGEAGDYLAYQDCVVTNLGTVTDVTTIRAWDFGPGSNAMSIRGCRVDNVWESGGVNYSLAYTDNASKALTGTVSGTSGTTTVTGVETKFLTELTLTSGDTADRIRIDGNTYTISSITSDTELTLSTNLSTSPSGATAYRARADSGTDVKADFANIGQNRSTTKPYSSSEVTINSNSRRSGTATITAGNTSVTVTHGLRRTPKVGEIMIVCHTGTATARTFTLSGLGATTFQINMSESAGADFTFGWRAELMDLN